MTDLTPIMHAKHALTAFREQVNARLDEFEAILDKALPPGEPGPGIRVPQGRQARKRFWKEHFNKAVSTAHGGRLPHKKSPKRLP